MSVFGVPGVTGEESPTSDDQLLIEEESPDRGEGREERESGDVDSLRQRLAESERKRYELEQQGTRAVAENVLLREQLGKKPEEGKRHTKESLKSWEQSDEGDTLSAAVAFTEQEVGAIPDLVDRKLEERDQTKKLQETISKFVPGITDKGSDIFKKVEALTLKNRANGVGRTDQESYVAALVETAGDLASKPKPKDPKEHNRERRIEASAGMGGGGQAPESDDVELTKSDLEFMRSIGHAGVDSGDPKVKRAWRKELLDAKKMLAERGRYR